MAIEYKNTNEVKKCLKLCSSKDCDCDSCSYRSSEKGNSTCTELLMRDALHSLNQYERKIVDMTDEYTDKLMKVLQRVKR